MYMDIYAYPRMCDFELEDLGSKFLIKCRNDRFLECLGAGGLSEHLRVRDSSAVIFHCGQKNDTN